MAVDLDAKGHVIGIEALCAENFAIAELAREAAVKVPKRLVDLAEYRTARRESAVA